MKIKRAIEKGHKKTVMVGKSHELKELVKFFKNKFHTQAAVREVEGGIEIKLNGDYLEKIKEEVNPCPGKNLVSTF